MYPAIILYLTNFVKTFLIIAGIYFFIKYVFRWLFPFLFQQGMKNMRQKMEDRQREQHRNYRREGDIIIENNRNNKSTIARDEGEYVDFEEVE